MKILPRKLGLLIIDDELSISPRGYRVPGSISTWSPGGDNLPGIDSWHTALRFWSSFGGGEVPDLVVADVRFILDRTTPLSMLFKPQDNNIPTGLSHLKTFAVLSRALGLPLGVGARTMDPTLWADQITAKEPEKRAMGYLAVHEIGELAAILGDGDEILNGGPDKQQHIRNCLRWLRVNSATEFEDGLRKAVRDYRRRLFKLLTAPEVPNVFVRPGHYAELLGWCRRMRENPQPLDAEHDIGLELTYYNGRRDLISLASLFADFDKITTRALGASAFSDDGQVVAEPWKLDDDGRPRIGAFLRQLGCSLKKACDWAAEAVRAYQVSFPPPKNYHPPKLAALKNRDGYSPLAAGLTVLFQFVRIEQQRVEQWEHSFANDSWSHRKLQFISGKIAPGDSLKRRLQKLADLTRRYSSARISEGEDAVFTRADLFDEFPTEWLDDPSKERAEEIDVDRGDHNKEWVKWHFDRLVDAGVLEYGLAGGEDCYKLNPAWLKGRPELNPPPAPRRLPRVVDAAQGAKSSEREPGRMQWLKTSLGYPIDDYNSVERALFVAFGGGDVRSDLEQEAEKANAYAKAGRPILKSLVNLDPPFFLIEFCRGYAADYLKWPASKWPEWLRATQRKPEGVE
jgi:hypothetical protein